MLNGTHEELIPCDQAYSQLDRDAKSMRCMQNRPGHFTASLDGWTLSNSPCYLNGILGVESAARANIKAESDIGHS